MHDKVIIATKHLEIASDLLDTSVLTKIIDKKHKQIIPKT